MRRRDAPPRRALAPSPHQTRPLLRPDIEPSRGQESETRATAAFVIEIAEQIGVQRASAMAHVALVTLDLGLAHYRDALEYAQVVFERDEVNQGNQVLADMIEAAVGAGDAPAAEAGMDRLSTRRPPPGLPGQGACWPAPKH